PQAPPSHAELSTAVDVWAPGVIPYELLTGQRPYPGGPRGLRQQIPQADPPAPPRSLNPRIDRDLDAVCLRCLRKDPAGRYGSAEALADDLQRCLDGRIPVARGKVRSAERLLRWCRRYPGPVLGGLIVLAFLVLLPVWAM